MKEMKLIEIRDRATLIPALAVRVNNVGDSLLWRAGFPEEPMVLLIHLVSMKSQCDPYSWGDRTMHCSHLHILDHWNEVQDGGIVDVEFILHETSKPKESESSAQQLTPEENLQAFYRDSEKRRSQS